MSRCAGRRPGIAKELRRDRQPNGTGVLVALVTVFPIVWMVSTAFKPSHEIFSLTPQPAAGPSDAAATSRP